MRVVDSAPQAGPALAVAFALGLVACATDPAPVGPISSYPGQSFPGQSFPGGKPHFVPWPASECVAYARAASGVDLHGNANTWWEQAEGRYRRTGRPRPGDVMVFHTAGVGHVAVVRRSVSDRLILIDHANWHGRGEVAVEVPVRDVSADNSWTEVNVWWLDTNQWGAKTYRIQGFIEPH